MGTRGNGNSTLGNPMGMGIAHSGIPWEWEWVKTLGMGWEGGIGMLPCAQVSSPHWSSNYKLTFSHQIQTHCQCIPGGGVRQPMEKQAQESHTISLYSSERWSGNVLYGPAYAIHSPPLHQYKHRSNIRFVSIARLSPSSYDTIWYLHFNRHKFQQDYFMSIDNMLYTLCSEKNTHSYFLLYLHEWCVHLNKKCSE